MALLFLADCHSDWREQVNQVVWRGWERSVTASSMHLVQDVNSLVRLLSTDGARTDCQDCQEQGDEDHIIFALNPNQAAGQALADLAGQSAIKLIVFGQLPGALQDAWGITHQQPDNFVVASSDVCPPAPSRARQSSASLVRFTPRCEQLGLDAPPYAQDERPLKHFDFTAEWNNLGFGFISLDVSNPWGVSQLGMLARPDDQLAQIHGDDGSTLATYMACVGLPGGGQALWVNRDVGCVDADEWSMVERFVANFGAGAGAGAANPLPCLPVLTELPYGHDFVATMRLDCDEDLASARPLVEAYIAADVPISLAVTTHHLDPERHGQQQVDAHLDLLAHVLAHGGGVASHSVNHLPNFGGDFDTALRECVRSKATLERHLGAGVSVDYMVAPFHQAPWFARAAMQQAGYRGVIAGIAANDPDMLVARPGPPPYTLPLATTHDSRNGTQFVTHSQQCMLHGECMLDDARDVTTALASPLAQIAAAGYSGRIFGYLDHPFSARYRYGWTDEAARTKAHMALIDHIRQRFARPLFWSTTQCMDYVVARSTIRLGRGFKDQNNQSRVKGRLVHAVAGDMPCENPPCWNLPYRPGVMYRGALLPLELDAELEKIEPL